MSFIAIKSTDIALLPLTPLEAIEDAIAIGDRSLHIAARLSAAQEAAQARADHMYEWAESEYSYRVCDDDYDDWYEDHYYAVHCTGCEQHCRLD